MRHLLTVAAVVLLLPSVALAQNTAVSGPTTTTTDNTTGCTALAQAAAAGMAAQITADDQSIKAPQSVTQLTCLTDFFNELCPNLGDGGMREAAYRGGWKPA